MSRPWVVVLGPTMESPVVYGPYPFDFACDAAREADRRKDALGIDWAEAVEVATPAELDRRIQEVTP